MITFSDCKINIGLNILRRRPDGYHDIQTCMLPVPWHDIIEIIPAQGTETTLTVLGNKVDCQPESNLVMRAYRQLESAYSLPPVDIILQKIIPDGAGLGGGSADASFTLKALNEMFSLDINKPRLAEIAATIGADCPFFIYDSPMLAEGIGDILTPIQLPLQGYTIAIAKPSGVNISTKQAYSGIKPNNDAPDLKDVLTRPVTQWQESVTNDFEPTVFALAPQIAELKAYMLTSGAVYASMSGSGASVYGIFDNDKLAESALSALHGIPHFMFKL